jgi:2-haloacid dehalogenase
MIDYDRFEAFTFDCYGTIIDWERGIVEASGPLLDHHDVDELPAEQLLELFGRLEAEAEGGPFRPYRDVLTEVALGIQGEMGLRRDLDRAAAFADSVGRWPSFPDSPSALAALGGKYRLAIVSNVDDDLFQGSAAQLGIDFDEIVTAQQVRSYKPAPGHFHEVLRRLDLPVERVLHVAQSLYHDIVPAGALGFTTVWVDRRDGRDGGGATPSARAEPDVVVADLASLAKEAGTCRAP